LPERFENFAMSITPHVYEIRPRKDHRGVDLISDTLPFSRLWYGEPNAGTNAIGYNEASQPLTQRRDSCLRCCWQRDRNARAQWRVQRMLIVHLRVRSALDH
jgi:hypothetical protein